MSPIFLQATTITAFLLISLLLSTPTTTTAHIVLDSEGNPLVAGSYYYAVPPWVIPRVGAGLTMEYTGSASCPSFIVAQSRIRGPLDYGIPIKFSPEISIEKNNFYTSSNVSIAFKYLKPEPLCFRAYSNVWTVSGPESENLVVLDGVEGSDGSWFKLEYAPHLRGSYYWIRYGDNFVLSDYRVNEGILLDLEKGCPLLVTFVKEESSMFM